MKSTTAQWQSHADLLAAICNDFELQVPGDELAPEFPAGSRLIFSSRVTDPQTGDIVLVADKHGAVHFREYRQTVRGWQAPALNKAHPTIRSGRVLSVMVAQCWRRGDRRE